MPNIKTDDDAIIKARGQRLKRLRNMANLSRQELCQSTGINHSTYVGWEVARHGGLSKKGAIKVLERIAKEGVISHLDWLLHGEGEPPSVLAHYRQATTKIDLTLHENQKIAVELSLFAKHYPHHHVLSILITDDTMTPQYQAHDHVAGICIEESRWQQFLHCDCIVLLSSGVTLVRQLRMGSLDHHYHLFCHNLNSAEPVQYNVKISALAPIVWLRRPFLY